MAIWNLLQVTEVTIHARYRKVDFVQMLKVYSYRF